MKTLAYVGETNNVLRFLQNACDGKILQYPTMESAGADAVSKKYDAIIAAAPAGGMLPSLSYEGMQCYAQLRKLEIPVYAEM
ncbi:MAG: hypothetical protein J6Q54_01225, partial [Oscillospiraceae bacterium]|nr:hypothetical protein [Oscillospiraceae bacterium]